MSLKRHAVHQLAPLNRREDFDIPRRLYDNWNGMSFSLTRGFEGEMVLELAWGLRTSSNRGIYDALSFIAFD